MKKIVFIGAGSIIFVKNLIGDCMLTPSLCDSEFALLDINREKLYLAEGMLKNLNRNVMTMWKSDKLELFPIGETKKKFFVGFCHQCHSGGRIRSLYHQRF